MGKLLALELKSLWGINRFRHTKDPRQKRTFCLLAVGWLALLAAVFLYVGGLSFALWTLGAANAVPGYLAAISGLLIFFFGIFQNGNTLFSRRGYDLLAAMPLSAGEIVVSRFVCLYLRDLALTLAVFLPGLGVYAWLEAPGLSCYLAALAGVVLIPALPLVLSAFLGTGILALSARVRHKSLVQTALMLILVFAVLGGSFTLTGMEETLTPEYLLTLVRDLEGVIGNVYPPARWLGAAMLGRSWGGLGIFAALSAAVTALALWAMVGLFHPTVRRLGAVAGRHDYRLGTLAHRGLRKALYLRELKRYFSSSVYVTNTIISPVMGAVLGGALYFGGLDALEGSIPLDISGLFPFVLGAVMTLMTTTSCAVSLEGRQFWAIQSLPIPAETWLDAKVLLNLTLMAPFCAAAEIFAILALKPGMVDIIFLLLIPAAICLFSAVFGITVDLKLPNFGWEKEEQVVKQGASAALGGFAGPLLSLVLGAVTLVLPGALTKAAMAGLLLLAAALLRRKNNTIRMSAL